MVPVVENSEMARPTSQSPRQSAPAPTVSVIIAARPTDALLAPIESLDCWRHASVVEVIVARGFSPSAQRNVAARSAKGDVLLFLDDDSRPDENLIHTYLARFAEETLAVAIGGPAIYVGSDFCERIGAAVLSDPWVTGRSAARYCARGLSRKSEERELILSNLAVRRQAFERCGGFDESLYPNEENRLLERLGAKGELVLYEPSALVTRPAPRAGRELATKVFFYGRGRSAQARRGLTFSSSVRIAAALVSLLALVASIVVTTVTTWPLVMMGLIAGLYSMALTLRIAIREGVVLGLAASPAALLVLLSYSVGVLTGLVRSLPHRRSDVVLESRSTPQ